MTLGRCSNMSEALGSLMGDIDILIGGIFV